MDEITSRERHIGRRLHSSPRGTRRSRAGHCSFRLIPAARHSIAWMRVPQAERRILPVAATRACHEWIARCCEGIQIELVPRDRAAVG
jgi:hypothetical protein